MNARRISLPLLLTACSLMVAVQGAAAATWYVATNGNDGASGTTWATAKQTIQLAIDAASANDTVLVSNGVFSTGGRKGTYGATTNRVFINKTLTLKSVNGATETTIAGGGSIGSSAIRCIYIDANARILGFTIEGGNTGSTGSTENMSGGGIFIGGTSPVSINDCVIQNNNSYEGGGGIHDYFSSITPATISNCIVRYNYTDNGGGGGIYGGKVLNCQLLNNWCSMHGGGAKSVTIYDSIIASNYAGLDGGGLAISSAHRCEIRNNTAYYWGGGAYNSQLDNSLVADNYAGDAPGAYGGGVALGTAINCIVTGNETAGSGGGINSCAATNSIIWGNGAGNAGQEYSGGKLSYCCTTPMPTAGIGNLTSNPLFVDAVAGNYQLLSNSPCINAGYNLFVVGTNDLQGNIRIFNRRVDIGAYEFQHTTATETTTELVPYAWLDQYPELLAFYGNYEAMGNATGPNGYPVWASYVAGLVPTNPSSQFTVGITVSNDTPRISWSPNLSPSRVYSILGKTNITDAIWNTSTNQASRFFRVKVSVP